MPPVYALNLFDLAPNEDYVEYQRRVADGVRRHGATNVWFGSFTRDLQPDGQTAPRQLMVLVEWSTREGFDAFRADPGLEEVHGLRKSGTRNYLWWEFERLEAGRAWAQALAAARVQAG